MAIQGIGQYSQYSTSYRKNPLTEVEPSAAQEAGAQAEIAENRASGGNQESDNEAQGQSLEVNQAPRSSNPMDFSIDFKKNNHYNLVAATSDTEDIDVDKALSAMQQDTVLEQYKFFVNRANLGTDADGTVRLK